MTSLKDQMPREKAKIDGNTVVLPESWMQYGRIVGAWRNYTAKYLDGKKSGRVGRKSPELIHMEGVQGELAFHWWLYNKPFEPTIGGYKDVPDLMIGKRRGEVRTRVRHGTERWPLELKVQTDDHDDAICVHVIFDQSANLSSSGAGRFEIAGWVETAWAKANVPLNDPGGYGKPQHFVGKEHLRESNELRRLVA